MTEPHPGESTDPATDPATDRATDPTEGTGAPSPAGGTPPPAREAATVRDNTFYGATAMVVGTGNTMNVHFPAPPKAVEWPYVRGLPPPRADGFRTRELPVDLTGPAEGGGDQLSWVLTGLGGSGKTQIAADLADRQLRDGHLDLLLWVTATSRDAIVASYAAAAHDLFGASDKNPDQAAAEFLTWLLPKPVAAGERPRRWLVVLDDVADPEDLRSLWPAPSPYGRTVATTRRQEASLGGDRRRQVPVGMFTPQEAADYLRESTVRSGRRDEAADLSSLAEDLGYLPLALAHARAYLADNPTLSCAEYRAELADRRLTLTDVFPEGSAIPGAPEPVALTWSLSLRRADALSPRGAARSVLQLVSFLDPNGVPAPVLAAPSVIGLLPSGTGAAPTARTLRQALGNLRRLSLAELDPERPTAAVRVHQLVQRSVRESLAPAPTTRVATAAADALLTVWEGNVDPATDGALRSNAAVLADGAFEHLLLPAPHEVLYRWGRSLGESGRPGGAARHFADLWQEVSTRFPDDDELLFKTRGYLAWWKAKSGDARGGAEAFASLLADQSRVLAPESDAFLQTRRSAAAWRGHAGDAPGAVAELERIYEDWSRIAGPDAPGAVSTRNHLAHLLARVGRHTDALAQHGEALREAEARYGRDDPRTVEARAAAMQHRGELGEPAVARDAYAELAAMRTARSPEHAGTLAARTQHAEWTGRAGDPAEAVRLLEAVLTEELALLGPVEVQTLAGRETLAVWRAEAGDFRGAVADLEALVPDQIAVLGRDNPAVDRTTRLLERWRTG
ncbi:FxSxx-COOH system tetratricopeptide repeat protein [Kitasatospora putterlickiae]|uniref:FxSxx-COOH system tetratricopeptide repeat protein n=1 Tax=Kitasatospora putterlickiae TaxID=221725 RepID=A0ABP4J4V6_9ACTN